ncbi:MAG TPA: PQQ-dependent sugar dehydrogenase, partial [Phycisphaerales bacterium]|nr:PQQ-dependent sugar dehydrogenase [Phycisphaerales bacterium]
MRYLLRTGRCSNALLIGAALMLLVSALPAFGVTPLRAVQVVTNIRRPTCLVQGPNDPTRMYLCQQEGQIRVIKNGVLQTTPFINLASLLPSVTLEKGVLSMVFDPGFATNGFFYVYYTDNASPTNAVIARFHATSPDSADLASRFTILRYAQNQHYGSWMDFGRDGYFYVSNGDGAEGDSAGRAQNITLLQGKMLRLDLDGPDNILGTADDDEFPADANKNYAIPPTNPLVGVAGEDEIWAIGLRNPWRCSFDRANGNLWIADVGQTMREEIDFQLANNSAALAPGDSAYQGGRNYGWKCREGTLCNDATCCNNPAFIDPVYQYTHSMGISITGGYVYRGCAIPDLVGTYVFGDWSSGVFTGQTSPGGAVTGVVNRTSELNSSGASVDSPVSFAEDLLGEIYIVDAGASFDAGTVFKIVPASFV